MGSNLAQGNCSFHQKLSSVEFPITFSQFHFSVNPSAILLGGDTLLAQGIYLTVYIYILVFFLFLFWCVCMCALFIFFLLFFFVLIFF